MKKKIIGIIVLVAIIAGVGFYIKKQNSAKTVNSEEVIKADISEYVEDIGVVKSKNEVNIYMPTAGKVSQILVDIGDKVKKGDVLVKLDKDEVDRKIKALSAERLSVLARYNEAKKPSNEKAIKKLELEIENISRKVENAQKDVNISEELYDSGAISNKKYEDDIQILNEEKSNLQRAKLDLELMREPVSKNIINEYRAQLQQIDIQRQGLEDLSKDYTIVSSIDGTVLNKNVENESFIQSGTAILTIGNTEELYIESDILISDIANIKEGSKVNISNKDLEMIDLKGRVIKIYPNAFIKVSDLGVEQKRIKIDIEMENTPANIRPNYDLDIQVIKEDKENTLVIPENAVFKIEEKEYVFINENGKAVLREVVTGIKSQREIEILRGLAEGDTVIISPDEDIKEGINIE